MSLVGELGDRRDESQRSNRLVYKIIDILSDCRALGENAVISSDPPSVCPLLVFTYLRVAARLCTSGMVGGIMTVQPRIHHFILRFALV